MVRSSTSAMDLTLRLTFLLKYIAGIPKWLTLDLVDMPIKGFERIDCMA